ncbi:SubName: Full=Uncharacterized protein {ECO:0000313/EMBL:CCA70757.1} [Serendipita indica DSM 11827]|nr:SubName: Full=Uncharacterized protein {ECO:0000313/EMBL:CCA70757.1} [Serendipita indica DSM 11827]
MPVLETPSRVWRRIQAADDLAVPSLPSLPAIDIDDDDDVDDDPLPSKRAQSTPSASISVKKSTTVRFAEKHESFEFSNIQPIHPDSLLSDEDSNKLPPEYSVDISAQFTPVRQPLNKNIALRTVRTPSLTRSASPVSTSPNNTPSSDAHVSLPNASRRSSAGAQQQFDLSRSSHSRSLSQSASSSQTKHSSIGEKSLSQTSKHDPPVNDTTVSHMPDLNATPQAKKRSFLLDVIHSTAKPRPRLSLHAPIQATPRAEIPIAPVAIFATPKAATVNDSFISTASSHDLTVQQPRINASFDHLTGAKGVGRFNATKLNTYLHGLNRRLVEENEELTNRLTQLQAGHPTITEVDESTRALEIAALESMVKDLESQLEREKQEKETERLKFKERVKEVESGVNDVVEQLERQLEVMAESKEQALSKARRAQELREDAEERAHRAELALAKGGKATPTSRTPITSPTGSGTATAVHEEFKEAIERVAELEEELRLSTNRSLHLEEELRAAEELIEELKVEKQTSDKKMVALRRQLEDVETDAATLQERLQATETELEEAKEASNALLAELEDAQEELAASQDEANSAKVDVELLQERINVLESRAERVDKEQRQLEEALEASEKKMLEGQEEIASLRQELERVRLITSSSARASTNTAVSAHPFSSALSDSPVLEDIEGLEKELDDAHREIGRLQHLLRDSPARAALAQAKEAKIEALEGENADLQEQVRTLRVLLSKGPLEGAEKSLRATREDGASPSVRNLPSIRNPRTPGGPLRDDKLSWLQSVHHGDESPYLHQISLLERELAHANECVDDKIDKLEEYGRGVTNLTEKLHDAENRIAFLQAEVQRLERREERRSRQASRGIACNGCGGTVELNSVLSFGDQSLCDASRGKDAVTDESMKKILKQLEKMKQDWIQEKIRLQGERDYLQGAADRLGRQAARKKESGNPNGTSDVEQVKQHVADLESQLQAERTRLRELATERSRMLQDKNDVAAQLQRTQADLDAVRDQLRSCKQENYALEADLRANTLAESKSRHLQNKVTQNLALIEQLRQERDQLAESHSKLQHRHQSAAENVDRLRKDLMVIQSNHEERRHQLDMQIAEIDDLRREMALKDEELSYERRRNAGIADLHSTVGELEQELAQMRQEAERFAQDLETLRSSNNVGNMDKGEVAKSERAQMQLRAQVRVLEEQLDEQKARVRQLLDEAEEHVCSSRDDSALSLIKARHNQECKGLLLQITYLKSKYTRENTLRQHLAHQKEYLLTLLSKLQQDDLPILKSLAHTQRSPKGAPVKRLRSIVHTVMFLNRAKKAAERWADQSAAKDQLAVALDDVRKRRLLAGRKSAPGIFN